MNGDLRFCYPEWHISACKTNDSLSFHQINFAVNFNFQKGHSKVSDLPLFGLNLSSCKCKLTVVYIVVVFVNFRLKEICLYCRCLSKLSPNRILLLLIEVNFYLHPLHPSTLQLHGVGRMIDKFRASQMSNFRLQ